MDLLQSSASAGSVISLADSLLPTYRYNGGIPLVNPLLQYGNSLATTASSSAVAMIHPNGQGLAHASTGSSVGLPGQSLPTTSSAIAFVTSDVLDSDVLIKGLQPGVEVHVLQSSELDQAIHQITQILAGRSGITSLQLFSHGSDGSLQLGNEFLNSSDLASYSSEIHSWSSALAPGADLLLYGCDVAQTDAGKAFVQQISQLTGADVGASIDPTGSAALGGNWTLEYWTGKLETPEFLQPWAQAAYNHILATFNVTNTLDSGAGSLRQAVLDANAASGADTITFSGGPFADQTPDTITLTSGQLPTITGDLTIAGPGAGLLTVSGNNASRIFQIDPNVNVTIAGLTIANGKAADVGGGILNNGGSVGIFNTTFLNNVAQQAGGGIFNAGGMLVNGGTFNSNSAPLGGSIYNAGGLEVRNSNFNTNQASVSGGGIYNNSGASLTSDNNLFAGNTANTDGGAIYNRGGGTMSILTTVIQRGSAGRLGGGIANFGTLTSMDNSFIQNNRSVGSGGAAGGVFNGGTANITNTSIIGNTAAGEGGGIYNNSGATLTLRANSLVNGNRGSRGGGIRNLGTATVGESTIISNRANSPNDGFDVSGAFISEGFNTIGLNAGSTGFPANNTVGDSIINPSY